MKKTKQTGDLEHELSSVSNIREYFRHNEKEMIRGSLSERLRELTSRAGLTRSALAAKAGVDRYYIYDILRGRKNPSADKLVCIAMALGLELPETEELLRLADRPRLYARHPRDSILIFALQHHLTVDAANAMLDEAGLPLLTEESK